MLKTVGKAITLLGQDPGFIKPSCGKAKTWNYLSVAVGFQDWGWRRVVVPNLLFFDFAWGDFNRLFWESSPLIFCWWSYIPSHSDYWYWSHSLGLETCANLRDSMAKKPMGLITLWGTAWTNICLSPLFPLQPSLRPLSNRTEGQSRESQTAFTMPL